MGTWLGVDVGGKRKGFDVAVVSEDRLLALHDHLDVTRVLELVREHSPLVVAIDSPRCFALDGQASREGERQLAREICAIRWTPDAARAAGAYYDWIHEGLALYDALENTPAREVIEVFPTASWTRWLGPRGSRSRSDWTRDGLTNLDLAELPKRTNQDQRDAIAAAITARQHTTASTEALGDLVVPQRTPRASGRAPQAPPGNRPSQPAADGSPPRLPVSAGALIHDRRGRLLILKPTYKKGWTIPGGQLEESGETPWEGAQRETYEECGLRIRQARLACVDFKRPRPGRPGGLRILFDCGRLADSELAALTLDQQEIEDHRFADPATAAELLSGPVRRRVQAASASDRCVYLEDGKPVSAIH